MTDDQTPLPPNPATGQSGQPASQPPASASAPTSTAAVTPIPPEVLKSAYNAFKKRWKLTVLDHESRIGRGPMSSGNKSSIVGIAPPDQFPRAVWEKLVEQGKLKYAGSGLYSRI